MPLPTTWQQQLLDHVTVPLMPGGSVVTLKLPPEPERVPRSFDEPPLVGSPGVQMILRGRSTESDFSPFVQKAFTTQTLTYLQT